MDSSKFQVHTIHKLLMVDFMVMPPALVVFFQTIGVTRNSSNLSQVPNFSHVHYGRPKFDDMVLFFVGLEGLFFTEWGHVSSSGETCLFESRRHKHVSSSGEVCFC